jgi:hypothetical protein
MGARLKHENPPLVTDEIARLHLAGFSLLPLGRTDGKAPLCKFRADERLSVKRILAPMRRVGSSSYGVRLAGLAVIDCDEESLELVRKIEARFGPSPVHVQTPRGRHLYYVAGTMKAPNLRGAGLPVDIKSGATSYVVGPHSIRPDGGTYTPIIGTLGDCNLPVIRDNQPQASGVVSQQAEGTRNTWLTGEAIKMVEAVNDLDELVENLMYCRDEMCEKPETVSDAEVHDIASWAWRCRLEGRVYAGRDSEFRFHRLALDQLLGLRNSSDAIALFAVLQDAHGHISAKPFSLSWEGMKGAGLTDLSERHFLDARRALEATGILTVAGSHCAGRRGRSYRLHRVRPQIAAAGNVSALKQGP